MTIFGCHTHGRAAKLVSMVGVSTPLQKHLHNIQMALLGSDAERSGTLVAGVIHTSTTLQQQPYHLSVTLPGC